MTSHSQYELTPSPTDAISSVRFHPKNPTKLLVTSWDRTLYLYNTQPSNPTHLLSQHKYRAPLLDSAWDPEDENTAYTVGLDRDVRSINLSTNEQAVLSTHDTGANHILYHAPTKTLVSSGWDATLHIHHPHGTPGAAIVRLPAKPFAMTLSPTKLLVAMATRQVNIYDMASLSLLAEQTSEPDTVIDAQPFQHRESGLKFMTRSVAAMPNDLGFACSSIEGRVAVEWFDEASQNKTYAFKCHRVAEKQQNQETAEEESVDVVYPVHCLAFHPVYGTFTSGGGDGNVALWDAVAKRRIRQYHRFGASVGAMEFSRDGKWLAIGVSPGFEDAKGDGDGGMGDGPVQVWVRQIPDAEVKGKAAK